MKVQKSSHLITVSNDQNIIIVANTCNQNYNFPKINSSTFTNTRPPHWQTKPQPNYQEIFKKEKLQVFERKKKDGVILHVL